MFKTYKLIETDEWFEIHIDMDNMEIEGFTTNVPKLYPDTHNLEKYRGYLKNHFRSFQSDIDWDKIKLVTVNLTEDEI